MYKSRGINEESLDKLKSPIDDASLCTIYEMTDANEAYEIFFQKFFPCYDEAFLLRERKMKNHKFRKQWINKTLYEKIKKRNEMYHRFIESKNLEFFFRIQKNIGTK